MEKCIFPFLGSIVCWLLAVTNSNTFHVVVRGYTIKHLLKAHWLFLEFPRYKDQLNWFMSMPESNAKASDLATVFLPILPNADEF